MTSDDNVSKKVNLKSKAAPLRRSVSTTSLGILYAKHLNLRDTKSYTGGMEDAKSVSSEENEVRNDKMGELIHRDRPSVKNEIETKDAITNEILVIKDEMLQCGGKNYTLNEIAHIWKKDCRIWLWKNCPELKRNKSVGEKIRLGLLKHKK
ncbi:uncharacterized protein LOC108913164 [Anoplophora glabripennis]|uniref:uncharacterized protein LOC108913164 n=1 Tax=Anoplophora glabripennis TaxID=217634 RepID=UPI0008738EC4|nr:uncharacterized protein LOC108913164 [Anoplophora glabripennis]